MQISVVLKGKPWVIKWVDAGVMEGDRVGECDSATRTIHILKGLTKQLEFDAIQHEMLHAVYPFLAEDAINRGSTDVAKGLKQIFKVKRRLDPGD